MVTRTLIELDEEKNKEKDPTEILETKEVKRKVKANYQLGEVLSCHPSFKYKVGDTVVYRPTRRVHFDLIKKSFLLDDYEVVGLWREKGDFNINFEYNGEGY